MQRLPLQCRVGRSLAFASLQCPAKRGGIGDQLVVVIVGVWQAGHPVVELVEELGSFFAAAQRVQQAGHNQSLTIGPPGIRAFMAETVLKSLLAVAQGLLQLAGFFQGFGQAAKGAKRKTRISRKLHGRRRRQGHNHQLCSNCIIGDAI